MNREVVGNEHGTMAYGLLGQIGRQDGANI